MRVLLITFVNIFIIINLSCKYNKNRTFIISHNTIKAVGNITDDTIFNGLIRFYDNKTDVLLYEAEYINSSLEGKSITYYKNGVTKTIEYYEKDKLNGYISFFDSTGILFCKQYYYYGLKMGPNVAYNKDGKESSMNFNSFDNESLLYFEYDSLKYKKLTQLHKPYFHYRITGDYEDSFQITLPTFFIYLLNAPKFKFEYSIVKVDSLFNDKYLYYTFNSKNIWKSINLNEVLSKNNITIKDSIAIKLFVYDSVRNEKYTMYKRIKW